MFENETYEVILQRMLARISDGLDKREGSIIYDALAPAAAEMAQLYIACDNLLRQSYADTASRPYLVRRAAERGLTPEPATKAKLRLEYHPTTIDLEGARFSRGALNYVCLSFSEGIAEVECETAGSVGNTDLGRVIPIDFISGLTEAVLTAVITPGADEEATEDFRARYLQSFESEAFGGNVAEYKLKTNAIEGVGATKVLPGWNGGGTVKLIILDTSYGVPSSVLVSTVQATMDPVGSHGQGVGIAPIGHTVSVVAASAVPVTITMRLTYDTGYSWNTLGALITAAVDAYLLELRRNWASKGSLTVFRSQIESRVLGIPGVLDISGTTINGETENLTLASDEVPLLSEEGVSDVA